MTRDLRRIGFIAGLVLSTLVALAGSDAASAAPPTPPVRTAAQLQADSPPPTAYDTNPGQDKEIAVPVGSSTRTVLGQLWRTVMALALVVGLILLGSRYVLPRMLGRAMTPSGKHIKVLERTLVDGRNALVLVEIGSGNRLLLGSSDSGLRLVAHVATPPAATFESNMGSAGTLVSGQGSRDAQTN